MTLKDDFASMRGIFKEAKKEWQAQHDKLWTEMTPEQRLAAADVIFRAIDDHAREGGSFRKLIYDRLGLYTDAYSVLYCAGGMNLSNEYTLSTPEEGTPDG